MRRLAALALALSIGSARAGVAPAPDTLWAQFLFVDKDQVYLRCLAPIGARDSLWMAGLGTAAHVRPPILILRAAPSAVRLQMGDSVPILRFVLPRRAADLHLACDPEVWDPLTIRSGSAYAAAGLFHRGLFRYADEAGQVAGDLARVWFWSGPDLYLVLDTAARFGDGTAVDAHAVKASLERYFWYCRDGPDYAWHRAIAGIDAYREGRSDQIIGIIPRSRDTLQFNLFRPLYELPSYLASRPLSIVRWQRIGDTEVQATAGHFAVRMGDRVAGSPPALGSLTLRDRYAGGDAGSARALAWLGTKEPADGGRSARVVTVALPELLIARASAGAHPALLTFVHHAIARDALGSPGVPYAERLEGLFPALAAGAGGPAGTAGATAAAPDLKRAREARELIRASRAVRIAAEPEFAAAAAYLVAAFRAWDLKARIVDRAEPCDLFLEQLRFDGFGPDAFAAAVLARLGLPPGAPLVNLLEQARSTADPRARGEFYRSLLARIADLAPYVALRQPVGQLRVDTALELAVDPLRGPSGPVFAPQAEP